MLELLMRLTYAQLSSVGPQRQNNEDYLGYLHPENEEEERTHGSVAIIADGVGGHKQGEVASRLAVETALHTFREAKPDTAPNSLIWQMFAAANQAVYDAGVQSKERDRMATTLTISLFRNDEVTIGHVGDCRVYLLQQGQVRRLTADHSYVGMQVKLGLISEQEAMTSQLRSMLTRSVGQEVTVQVDSYAANVNQGDFVMQCTDGLYTHVAESEIAEIVTSLAPEEACSKLIAMAEERRTEDNLSVQVVRIEKVERVLYHMGVPYYREAPASSGSHEVQVGQVLDERFHIVDMVNRSGMATIFKAIDLKSGQNVAIKIPFMQFESDPGFADRFEREETIGKSLSHPAIMRVLPVEDKSRVYMVMEYLEGQTLRHLLKNVSPLPVADALQIAIRICTALDYLHKNNVVHRDLKPENVMICNDGSLRIIDFGIAKVAGFRRLSFSGFSPAMGTPDYMAPEQVKGKRGDQRTDIYSLGAMLYEMVTGSPPFEGVSPYMIMNARVTGDPTAPRRINPEIPPEVEEIILHAMERNPIDRYGSAAQMLAELASPDSVQLTGRCERLMAPVAWKAKWRTVRLIVLSALIPLIAFGLMFLIFHKR
jgi:serine/threonine protein phosphatase PrpC